MGKICQKKLKKHELLRMKLIQIYKVLEIVTLF